MEASPVGDHAPAEDDAAVGLQASGLLGQAVWTAGDARLFNN